MKRSVSGAWFLVLTLPAKSALAQGAPPEGPAVPPPRTEAAAPRGNITPQIVFVRAADTSFSAKAQESALVGAAARVDSAWAAFLPRLTASGSYRRLSDFKPPNVFGGGGALVATLAPSGTLNPSPTIAVEVGSFPIVLDNYVLQASIAIPISDYFLRINQNYSAMTNARDAARFDVAAARAKSGTEGELAYYSWVRSQRALVVAKLAMTDQETHLKDVKNQFSVGNASKADVLRAETAVAAAELQRERTKNLVELTEKQVRLAIHAKDGEAVLPTEEVGELPPFAEEKGVLVKEALEKRAELRSLAANAESMRRLAAAATGSALPSISAFGTGTYANPNPRRFPQQEEWFGTWEVGAQITWSPNDILTGTAGRADYRGRAAQLEAQTAAFRDAVELEVTQAVQAAKEAEVAIETSKRQLASAEEAYRVAHELFVNGRATSTMLTDAETELTRARLENVNASVDARVARVRIRHAVGRDVDLAKVQ